MKTAPSSSLLLLLSSLQPSSASFLDWFFGRRCPRAQFDFKYYLFGAGLLSNIKTYLDFFPQDDPAILSIDAPGLCTTTYHKYSSTKEQLELMVTELYDGTAYRFNDLAFIRLKDAPFDCKNSPWSNDYCGIAIGIPTVDHEIVRPFLDEVLGDGTTAGDQSLNGLRWNMADLKASAEAYLATTGDTINTGSTPQVWVIKELHKVALGLDLTDDEVQEVSDLFAGMLIHGVTGALLPPGLNGLIETRRKYIGIYETTIRAMIASGDITSVTDSGDNVKKAAWTIMDAFNFAGFPSIFSVIKGALGSYYNGQVDDSLDLTTHMGMGRVVFETVRLYPPVLGVTRINTIDGTRSIAAPGLSGYDPSVWGDDALEFNAVRMDFATYQSTSLSWADAALPVPGVPHTAHLCPAKSFSFNLAVAFLLAMGGLETWEAPDVPAVPEAGAGPAFWSDFTVTRL